MQSPEGHWIGGPGDLALDASGRLYIAAIDAVMRVSGIPPVAGDSTPPMILPGTSGTPGTNGWWRGPSKVTVQLSAIDNESFITSHSGCGTHEVTSDTPGTTFTCTATSAGGTSTLSVTVRRDSVAPTLTFGSASFTGRRFQRLEFHGRQRPLRRCRRLVGRVHHEQRQSGDRQRRGRRSYEAGHGHRHCRQQRDFHDARLQHRPHGSDGLTQCIGHVGDQWLVQE